MSKTKQILLKFEPEMLDVLHAFHSAYNKHHLTEVISFSEFLRSILLDWCAEQRLANIRIETETLLLEVESTAFIRKKESK